MVKLNFKKNLKRIEVKDESSCKMDLACACVANLNPSDPIPNNLRAMGFGTAWHVGSLIFSFEFFLFSYFYW